MSDKFEDVSNYIQNIGYTPEEFVRDFAHKNIAFFSMSDSAYQEYKHAFEIIESKKGTAQQRGKLLEQLVTCLFFAGKAPLFQCIHSCKTSTNEIDVLVNWSLKYKTTGISSAFPFLSRGFLCECKNYTKAAADVTYVGKFYSLLRAAQTSTGIMISMNGVTGRTKWDGANGLIKKIALRDQTFILVFDKRDLKSIYKDKTVFWELIRKKYKELQQDVEFDRFVQEHEYEADMEEFIESIN